MNRVRNAGLFLKTGKQFRSRPHPQNHDVITCDFFLRITPQRLPIDTSISKEVPFKSHDVFRVMHAWNESKTRSFVRAPLPPISICHQRTTMGSFNVSWYIHPKIFWALNPSISFFSGKNNRQSTPPWHANMKGKWLGQTCFCCLPRW